VRVAYADRRLQALPDQTPVPLSRSPVTTASQNTRRTRERASMAGYSSEPDSSTPAAWEPSRGASHLLESVTSAKRRPGDSATLRAMRRAVASLGIALLAGCLALRMCAHAATPPTTQPLTPFATLRPDQTDGVEHRMRFAAVDTSKNYGVVLASPKDDTRFPMLVLPLPPPPSD
jgi:hypothetical protein